MANLNLSLSADEAALLRRLLETALGEVRVEVHHTRKPSFREEVKEEEALLRGLVEKLQQQPS